MRSLTWMVLLLLAAAPLWAKPKVEVRIRVSDGFGKNLPQDSLSKSNSTFGGGVGGGQVFYLNV